MQKESQLFETHNLECAKGQEPLRIDKFLMIRIEGATRNKIQQAINDGRILINDEKIKASYKIKPGDRIKIFQTHQPDPNVIKPEKIPLNIVYEDDDLMIVNKPAGLVVHPGSGNWSGTLVNGVAYHLQQQRPDLTQEELTRFGLVHRIDKDTSGLLVLGKTPEAMKDLAKQFFDHTIHRRYQALVWGDVADDEGTIECNVGRHQRFRKKFTTYPEGDHGKKAITHYKVLERFYYVTLIECRLETGRTHQIRVHMKYKGYPLFNDHLYGGDKILKGTIFSKYRQFVENCFEICQRQALHAKELGFVHPATRKKLLFTSELPEDMVKVIEKWRRYVKHNT